MDSKQRIIEVTIPILARAGYDGTSMRKVADASGVEASVLYYYFQDKESLLRAVRLYVNEYLDQKIHQLPHADSVHEMLRQRVEFNIEESEKVVCLLQYFMAAKQDFPLQEGGYVPSRAYRHMRDVLERGIADGEYQAEDPDYDAKIMTHLINGFLLEYYPHHISDRDKSKMIQRITAFIEGAVKK